MKKGTLWKRDFTLMICGQVVSLLGNAMLRFALSLYVLDETGSAAAFGSMLAVSLIPTVLLSPVGGLLADRVSKQKMMAALDFLTALLLLLFLAGIRAGGGVFLVALLMVLLSVISACYQPAVQASVPLLAEEADWPKANGAVVEVNAISSLAGPILGGVLYGFFSFLPMVAVSAGCFFLSAVMELFLRIPFTRPEQSGGMLKTAAADLLTAGRFLKSKPALPPLLLVFAGLNLTVSSMLIIGLPFTVRVFLGLGDTLYGLAQAAPALGMILGGLLAGIGGSFLSFRRSHLLLLAASGALLPLAASLSGGLPPLLAYALCLFSATVCLLFCTVFNIAAQTYLQQQTPPALLGRVGSFVTVLCMCASPAGQAVYGLLFEKADGFAPLVVLATCAAGLLLGLLTWQLLGRLED
ncbi:MAG: MFS transporter [Provencibacterium sp.]|nr:MFS transporter [Provencibacterium sp.]